MRSVLLLAWLLAGCARDAMPGVPEQQDGVATVWWREPTPYRIDLLFVIDDSPAMQPFQSSFAEAMRQAGFELRGTGEAIDVRIAVTTADLGDEQNAPYTPVPGQCAGWGDAAALRPSVLVDGSYIAYRSVGNEVRTNVTGSAGDALRDLTAVGTGGCAHPRPLEAMRMALEREARGGFLRDNAKLSVVIIAGQEDESPRLLSDYEAFLKGLGRDVAVVVSGGTPLSHGCGEPSTDRLYAFSHLFPNRGTFFSNCGLASGGLAGMALFYHLPPFGPPFVSTCFAQPLADVDPATPGVQPACTVTEHLAWGTPDEHERLMTACGTGALPCWKIVEDSYCGSVQNLRVDVDRGGEDAPDNDVVEAQCVSS